MLPRQSHWKFGLPAQENFELTDHLRAVVTGEKVQTGNLIYQEKLDAGTGGYSNMTGETTQVSVLSNSNGRLLVSSYNNTYAGCSIYLPTQVGKVYRVAFNMDIGNNPATQCYLNNPLQFNTAGIPGATCTTSGDYSFVFTSPTAGVYLQFDKAHNTPGPYYFSVDNVTVYEVPSIVGVDFNDGSIGGFLNAYNGTTIVSYLINENNRLKVYTTDIPMYDQMYTTCLRYMPTVNGKRYRIDFDMDLGNCPATQCQFTVIQKSLADLPGIVFPTSGHYSFEFTAISDGMYISFHRAFLAQGHYNYFIDNFVVTEVGGSVANIVSLNDYHEFGMNMKERSFLSGGSYKYGYQGSESDREITNTQGFYTTDYRTLDARLGRWFSNDLLADHMPSWSPYSFCFNNPLNFVDIDGAIPTPLEGAIISKHIYYGNKGDVISGGWKLIRIYTDENSASFRAGLYSRVGSDGVMEYAMANAGTYAEDNRKGRNSWYQDFKQPFGNSEDMVISITTATKVSNEIGKAELTFVGHSKGGAEAASNALATDRNALLYNPAAINAWAYGLDSKHYKGANEKGMTAYIVDGEAINTYINKWFAKPIDKVVYLPTQSSSSITNHMIESVIKAINATQPKSERIEINFNKHL